MKSFHFQKFVIKQNKNVFRVGTDGVLLGALVTINEAKEILEIGIGTGLISLMIAQRNSLTKILALEINSDAAHLAQENFRNSPFGNRIEVALLDFNDFKSKKKFDLIVSNPPYFKENSSTKDTFARQQTVLTFENLIENAASNLAENGIFSVIIPFEDGDFFKDKCADFHLKLIREIKIYGIKNSTPKRWILEFSLTENTLDQSDFTIENSPRIYSEEYLELTKDFHVFKEKT